VKAEGYDTLEEFKSIWIHINKEWDPDLIVWKVSFKVVPETDLKKGDIVRIVGSAEESKYDGFTWKLIEDPRRIHGFGQEVVRMELLNPLGLKLPEDFHTYDSAYETKYLVKVFK
jgi:hypothetical protein